MAKSILLDVPISWLDLSAKMVAFLFYQTI
jgi:hypothetical protein